MRLHQGAARQDHRGLSGARARGIGCSEVIALSATVRAQFGARGSAGSVHRSSAKPVTAAALRGSLAVPVPAPGRPRPSGTTSRCGSRTACAMATSQR